MSHKVVCWRAGFPSGLSSLVCILFISPELASVGCTLRLVLEWAWKRITVIKEMTDNMCKMMRNIILASFSDLIFKLGFEPS